MKIKLLYYREISESVLQRPVVNAVKKVTNVYSESHTKSR
jgi:hypothetical protein